MPLRNLALAATAALTLTVMGCASLVMDGRRLMNEGRYDGAIDRFTRHLEGHPADWKAREQLAYAYLKSGRYPEAVQAFERVRSERPGSRDTLIYLGLAYLRNGQLTEGMESWRALLKVGTTRQAREISRLLILLEIAESRQFTEAAISGRPLPARPGVGRKVGVLYHNDLSAEKGLGAVQKSLAAMLIHDLSEVEGIRVAGRVRMDALLDAVRFKQTGLVVEADIPETGRLLGVDILVYGTLSTLLRDLRVNTTIAAPAGGGTTESFLCSDLLDRFFHVQKQVLFGVLERLGQPLSEKRRKLLSKPHTEDFDAFLVYGKGLDALDAGEWEAARLYFERAVEADSGFTLAKKALETCPAGMGIDIGSVERMGLDPAANREVTDRMEVIVEPLASFPG